MVPKLSLAAFLLGLPVTSLAHHPLSQLYEEITYLVLVRLQVQNNTVDERMHFTNIKKNSSVKVIYLAGLVARKCKFTVLIGWIYLVQEYQLLNIRLDGIELS